MINKIHILLFLFLFVTSAIKAQYQVHTRAELLQAMTGTRDIRFNTYWHKNSGVSQSLKGISVDSLLEVAQDFSDSVDVKLGDIVAYVSPTGSDTGVINSLRYTWDDPWKAAEYLQGLGIRKGKVHVFPGKYKLGNVGCSDCTSTYVSNIESHLWKLPEMYIHLELGATIVDSVMSGENSTFLQTSVVEDTSFLFVSGNGRFYKYTGISGGSNGVRCFINRDVSNLPKVGSVVFEADYVQSSTQVVNTKKLKTLIFNVKDLNCYGWLGFLIANQLPSITDTLFVSMTLNNVVHNIRNDDNSIQVESGVLNDFQLLRLGFSQSIVCNIKIDNYRGVQSNRSGLILGNTTDPTSMVYLNLVVGNAYGRYFGSGITTTDFDTDFFTNAPLFSLPQQMKNSYYSIDCKNCYSDGSSFEIYNIGDGSVVNITGNYTSRLSHNLSLTHSYDTTGKVITNGNFTSYRANVIVSYTAGGINPSFTSQLFMRGSYYCTQSGIPNILTRSTDMINLEFAKLVSTGSTYSITTDYGTARSVNILQSFANNLPNTTAPNNIIEVVQGLNVDANIK